MTVATLTTFLGWCTAINMGFMVLWAVAILGIPDLVFRIQRPFVHNMERKEWDLFMFGYMAMFKVMVIVFNLVPYMALKLMA